MTLGDLKVAAHQSAFLVSICNLGMIGYLFIEKRGWSWWYLLFPLVVVLYNIFYFKYLRPKEMTSNWQASPPFMQLQKNVEEIKEIVENGK